MVFATHKSGGGFTTAKRVMRRLQRPRAVQGYHEDDGRTMDVYQDFRALMSKNEIMISPETRSVRH